jgi:uncharacterized cupredoxin-like copper-binding protein
MTKTLIGRVRDIMLSGILFSLVAHAAAQQVIAITLQDPTTDSSLSGMVMKTDTATVKAGRVTLEAVNQSRNLVHEVLVVPALPEGTEFPYDTKKDVINERRAHPLGEISDLKPGARGKLTLNLKPGTYLLLCNEPGHYKSGMWIRLGVEK